MVTPTPHVIGRGATCCQSGVTSKAFPTQIDPNLTLRFTQGLQRAGKEQERFAATTHRLGHPSHHQRHGGASDAF